MKLGPLTVTYERRPPTAPRSFRMVWLLAFVVVAGIGVHEVFYHRFTPGPEQVYPFYGMLSHPATDMALLAAALLAVAWFAAPVDGDKK